MTGVQPAPVVGADGEEQRSTRERILDAALDLFLEKGFDKTSLREIAEKLGFTKAALYYHFESKDDIFMALHLRLHQLAHDGIEQVTDDRIATVESWVQILDGFIDMIPANRKLIAMFERNRAAFEALHTQAHADEHDALDETLRHAVTDPSIPVEQRVRMAFAFSGMLGALIFAGDAFTGMSSEELVDEMKRAVRRAVDV
ncbi:MAG: TetR/AcrR family transcriptional regulator [Acidimicrobiales bacterium]|jgi:AcrR family transcriptional regulator